MENLFFGACGIALKMVTNMPVNRAIAVIETLLDRAQTSKVQIAYSVTWQFWDLLRS